MTSIKIQPWSGSSDAHETEAEALDGRWLSLYAGRLPACPDGRWAWTADTYIGIDKLRPIGTGIAFSSEEAMSAAEDAARCWLRPTPRLEPVA